VIIAAIMVGFPLLQICVPGFVGFFGPKRFISSSPNGVG
jgi:hypothetical protein